MGGNANILKAVRLTKNLNPNPHNLTLAGLPIAPHDIANSFEKHFNVKIQTNVNKLKDSFWVVLLS